MEGIFMKRIYLLLSLLTFAQFGICETFTHQEQALQQLLPDWQKIKNDSNEDPSFNLGFIPMNESLDAWTNRISLGFMPYEMLGNKVDATAFAEMFHVELQQKCPNMDWTELKSSPEQAIVLWQVHGCGRDDMEDQIEMVNFIRNDRGFMHIHYVVKNSFLSREKQESMLTIITHPHITQLVNKQTNVDAIPG